MFKKLPLQLTMALAIIAMGLVGLALALYVGESYRQFTLATQRGAYEDIIHLRTGDHLQALQKLSKELGQAVQNNIGFRQSLKVENRDTLQSYLESQFHQYFVTAGLIRLNALIALDQDMNVIGLAVSPEDRRQGIGGTTCPSVLKQAFNRQGAEKLKTLADICLENDYPLMHVIIPVGGFQTTNYIDIVSHPAYNIINIEKELGLPLKIVLPNGSVAFQSPKWPKAREDNNHISAVHHHYNSLDQHVFDVHVVRDITLLNQQLQHTRDVSMHTAVLITLAFAILMLYFVRKTTLNPILTIARHLRDIQADHTSLGKTVEISGNKELQQLAQGYNNMTCKLKTLYDELAYTNAELKAEVLERQRAEEQLKLHRDHLGELVEKRTTDLAIARDAAVQASKAKSQFLANMSHELRTPLNAIIGYSELLLECEAVTIEEDTTADVKKILTSGKHLLTLINDILDISKIEAGKVSLELYDFSVAELLEDIALTTKPLVAKNRNRLLLEYPTNIGYMCADATKLTQVLLNLISNAAKFTDEGNITLTAEKTDEERILFKVKDTGIGLKQGEIDKLFRPFSQADNSTTRKYGGTGLGLAISRHYCQLMGGDLWAAGGTPDTGAEFSVCLPMNVKEPVVLPINEAGHELTPCDAKASRIRGGDGLERRRYISKVLIVDEDHAVCESLRALLLESGYEAQVSHSAEQAIDKVYTDRPDVVILDMLLSGNDGWSVLTKIKQDPRLQHISVIVVSIMEDKNIGYALGAIDYLPKPIDPKRLTDLVNKNIRKNNSAPILLIESDDTVRYTIKQALRNHHWQIIEAENVPQAMAVLERQIPALIIHALIMQEMDGIEFLSKLQADERWRSIPHITISPGDLTHMEQQRLQQSVNTIMQHTHKNSRQAMDEVVSAVGYCAAG